MHVAGSDARLRALLRERNVAVGVRSPQPSRSFSAAWSAFKRFTSIRVDPSDLDSELPNDDLLYEFGVFDFGSKWGRTFELSFVRQYATADGDLQQVHLVAHFPPAAFADIQHRLRAVACSEGSHCAADCYFEGNDNVIGTPCVVASRAGGSPGRRVKSVVLWAAATGTDEPDTQRRRWIEFVEGSPAFAYVLAHRLRLIGYEVWQESAE